MMERVGGIWEGRTITKVADARGGLTQPMAEVAQLNGKQRRSCFQGLKAAPLRLLLNDDDDDVDGGSNDGDLPFLTTLLLMTMKMSMDLLRFLRLL